MWRVFGGAALVVAGIAAFIEAHSHKPFPRAGSSYLERVEHSGALSQTAYDLLRIGAWALVIVGALLVVTGLIQYWGAPLGR